MIISSLIKRDRTISDTFARIFIAILVAGIVLVVRALMQKQVTA